MDGVSWLDPLAGGGGVAFGLQKSPGCNVRDQSSSTKNDTRSDNKKYAKQQNGV